MLVPAKALTLVADLTVESEPVQERSRDAGQSSAPEVESLPAQGSMPETVQEPINEVIQESIPVAVQQESAQEPVQGDLLAVEAVEHQGAVSVAVPGEAEQQSFPLGDG